MEKISLYDFIVFFVPGATFILLSFWFIQALENPLFGPDKYPKELLLIVAILPCYFIGNLLSWIAFTIEGWRTSGEKDTWVAVLEDNQWLADKLNEICIAKWAFAFKENGEINKELSERFYDLAYQVLDVEEKLAKVRTLYVQYRLFSNSVPLSIVAFIVAASIILQKALVLHTYCSCCAISAYKFMNEAILLAVASIVFCWLALHFYPLRRRLMMKALFEMFYAYSVINK